MRNRFDQQLAKLHSDLIIMGGLCETAIAAAVDAVTKGDVEMAKAPWPMTARLTKWSAPSSTCA